METEMRSAKEILDSLGAPIEEILLPTEAPVEDANTKELAVRLSSMEEKALKLLSIGISNEQTANALGVTAGRISQMLSNEVFAGEVAAAKYKNLQQHSERDGKYDTLEDKLLTKLEAALPLMIRPEMILKSLQTVNSAKRRGQQSTDLSAAKQTIVSLVLPTQIVQQFQVNIANQVTKAGDQELLTMTSANLLKTVETQNQAIAGPDNANPAGLPHHEQERQ